MNQDDTRQLEKLRTLLRQYKKIALAFSGGVDSAFLLHVAIETLGRDNVLAITAEAENFPEWEAAEAAEFAGTLGARRLLVPFNPFAIAEFANNDPERCYYCKLAIFTRVVDEAKREGFSIVADGTNQDDPDDYRPGLRAIHEQGIVSPLLEAGLRKAAIRRISQAFGLPFWNKPSFACLASRFPYGESITPEKLLRLEKAEAYFLGKGLRNIRVRSHNDLARIEVDPGEREKFFSETFMDEADRTLKAFGFRQVALDLAGYRTGSMNTLS